MTSTTHQRSIHIDAPVEKVFDYVKDPHNFYAIMTEIPVSRLTGHGKAELTGVEMAPDGGVGSTWSFKGSVFIHHFDAVLTRKEYVPNERIVDDNPDAGATWTSTFEPDDTGTSMSLAFTVSSRLPLLDKALDFVYWNGDRDLETMLDALKKAIET